MSNSEAREYIDFELKKRNDKQPSNTGTSLVKLVTNLYMFKYFYFRIMTIQMIATSRINHRQILQVKCVGST